MTRIVSHRETGERYLALRFAGGLFVVIGFLLLAAGVVLLALGLWFLQSRGTAPPLVASTATGSGQPLAPLGWAGGALWTVWSFALVLSGLQSVAVGALCRLAIHVEENTRVTAQCLERLRSRAEAAEGAAAPLFRS